jgi:hypothetical protein
VLERKERKKIHFGVLESTEVYWPLYWLLQISYLSLFLWWIWIMILLDLFSYPPQFSMSVPCVALTSELFTYSATSAGWVSSCYTVGCRTVFMTINLSGLCRIRDRVFPVRRLYSCLLYSGSRTLFVPIRYTVYRLVLFTCVLKIVEWSVSYIDVLCTYLLGALHYICFRSW